MIELNEINEIVHNQDKISISFSGREFELKAFKEVDANEWVRIIRYLSD